MRLTKIFITAVLSVWFMWLCHDYTTRVADHSLREGFAEGAPSSGHSPAIAFGPNDFIKDIRLDGNFEHINRGWTMIPTSSLSSNSELSVRVARSLSYRFTWTMPIVAVNADMEDFANFDLLTSWYLEYDGVTTQIKVDTNSIAPCGA
ncbi:hypothetical protein GGX14DRAFT_396724 [Mycena pura]|uniref:Uncharacterized protein n=1 Tax=Mycena pura TaxID=153505 RepID=A0AAD6YD86_9AGAR|nr:hypothetical protein GGX14DRAFT_396721 [Mycena pura]KAJ7206792.1 hypothetical protein GGX14DRAFT_396724 [Mycena pura]